MEVNKRSIEAFFSDASVNRKKIIIPEYQRSYAWNKENVEILFEDLVKFSGIYNENTNRRYFLGNILYIVKDNEIQIIDGQQRITTLMLLIRAFYNKIIAAEQAGNKVGKVKQDAEQSLWYTDRVSGIPDLDSPILESRVYKQEFNLFTEIMRTGVNTNSNDNKYSLNYKTICTLVDEFCKNNPLGYLNFVSCVLLAVEFACIQADELDSALSVFSTLNSRGIPLTEFDIFKAEIIRAQQNDKDRDKFLDSWYGIYDKIKNNYCSEIKKSGKKEPPMPEEFLQDLFASYMYYLYATEEKRDTSMPSMHNYFSETIEKTPYKRLQNDDLMIKLDEILNLKLLFDKNKEIQNEDWSADFRIQKLLDILSLHPYSNIIHPITIYYLQHHTNPDFLNNFESFLKKYTAVMILSYIEYPNNNSVKNQITGLNLNILQKPNPVFTGFKYFAQAKQKDKEEVIKEISEVGNKDLLASLLAVYAYSNKNQKSLLPENWEIEHIFPKTWNTQHFTLDEEEVKRYIELLGNKMPLEKEINISASNGYFDTKCNGFTKRDGKHTLGYKESSIAVANEMANLPPDVRNRWCGSHVMTAIEDRGKQVAEIIYNTLIEWDKQYCEQ